MSFYGNVFQELTNAFASFIIQSKYGDTTSQAILEAYGTGGQVTFAPGNDWIALNADVKDFICTIEHTDIDTNRTGTNIIPFSKANAAAGTPTQLMAGDIIAIPAIKYDKAGHIITADVDSYFKLPVSEVETNIQDLQDRMAVLEDAEDAQNDRMGKIETTYEGFTNDIDNLQTRMATLEDAEGAQNDRLAALETTSEEYGKNIDDLQGRVEELEGLTPRVETLEETSQAVVKLLGERASMTKETDLTVTQVIGDFDTLKKNLKYEDVCDGLTTVTQEVNAANSSISNNALAVRVAVKNLCDILNAYGITDQDGNPIDSNKLWNI